MSATVPEPQGKAPQRSWVPLALGGVALSLLVAGGLLLRATFPAASPAPPIPVRGRQSPKEFGLPVYPTALAFHSLTPGPGRGSSAYGIKSGTAGEVVDFYRERLDAGEWRFQSREPHQEELGEPGKTRVAKGWRTVWRSGNGQRRLTLIALDLPQQGTTGQILLMWEPVSP